jgi:hypothetical protein
MDNVDKVLAALREFFARDPGADLHKGDVPALTGIEMGSVHPILQLMCGGPSSPYENGPRADALRGILVRFSSGGRTKYKLSAKGGAMFGLSASTADSQAPLPLLDFATIANVLLDFEGKTFNSHDFERQFAIRQPVEYAAIVARHGSGDAHGKPYTATSYLANSLALYARKWDPAAGLPQLTLDGLSSAPASGVHRKIGSWRSGDGSDDVAADVLAILDASGIDRTERDLLVKARVGQGRFRQNLLDYWRCACPVTGCNDYRVLVASHIKRWCDSDNRERLDPFNGLLLTPNMDRLFDMHLISFGDDGRLLVSARIAPAVLDQLGICVETTIPLDVRHQPYLADHRERMAALDAQAGFNFDEPG